MVIAIRTGSCACFSHNYPRIPINMSGSKSIPSALREISPSPDNEVDIEYAIYGRSVSYCSYSLGSLILVPSASLFSVEEWGVLSSQCMSKLSRSSSKFRVLAFEHLLLINQNFLWQNILDAGGLLLDSLLELDRVSEV